MENPNIIFPEANKAVLIDCPIAEPKAGEVRVKLVRSTISSGTERANLVGEVNVAVFSNDTVAHWPRQSGYSSSGVIDAIGEGVNSLKVGDRVAVSWSKHSAYVTVDQSQVVKIPDDVSFSEAALAHISTFPMLAVRKCNVQLGESAMVMGQGVLGQLAVMLLKASGATPVIACDPVAEKRERALALGADFAFDPTSADFVKTVRDLTPLPPSGIYKDEHAYGVNAIIEVTGVGAALNTALDVCAPMGRIALLGCTRNSNFSVDYYHKVHGRGVSLIGANTWARPPFDSNSCAFTHQDDVKTFLKLLQLKRISLDGFVAETHSISECQQVYARLARGGAFPVIQFDWSL